MALLTFDKDMDIIAALDDQPNDVGGLTAAQLKAKFDEGGAALQEYLNDTLLPQLESLGVEKLVQRIGTGVRCLRIGDGGALEVSENGVTWAPAAVAGHEIRGASGAAVPQRAALQFADGQVTDSGGCTVVTGLKGEDGATWYPTVSSQGVLSFSRSDSATPPAPVNIRGPQGAPGADGTSFSVLGRYDTLEALQAAHPAGGAGDAYAVGTAADNTIYLWSADAAAWQDVGALQGPAGADGQSAYQAAVAGGYAGSEADFRASLAAVGSKADRAVPAAAGNLAALDASGNLTDSGVAASAVSAPAAAAVAYDDGDTGLGADDVQSAIESLFTSASEGKAQIAAAVTGRGGQAAADDTFAQLAAAITALPSGGGAAVMTGVTVAGGSYTLGDDDKYVLHRYASKGAEQGLFYLVDEGYAVVSDGILGTGKLQLLSAADGLTLLDDTGANGIQISGGQVLFTTDSITVYRRG